MRLLHTQDLLRQKMVHGTTTLRVKLLTVSPDLLRMSTAGGMYSAYYTVVNGKVVF